MSKTIQLISVVIIIIGVIMAVLGGTLTMKDSVCNCPPAPRPNLVVVIPIIDTVLLYLGILISIFGIIIFVVSYFREDKRR